MYLLTMTWLHACSVFLMIATIAKASLAVPTTSPTTRPPTKPTIGSIVTTNQPTYSSTETTGLPAVVSTRADTRLPTQPRRTVYCSSVYFYLGGDGLKRYFECCDTVLKPAECFAECPCFNGGYCDRTTKSCRCPAGRTGTHCETECTRGHYGLECIDECTCGTEATCDLVNGRCTCADDEEDSRCHRCIDGMYGPTCKVPCMCAEGGRCDSNGTCLKGTETVASYLALAVVLGVLLGVVLIVGCILFAYCTMKWKENYKANYVSLNTSDAIPFDVGVGRNSLDLLDSSMSAPRNMKGLKQYLSNNPAYMRQTSGMENRVLPNIPEAQAPFLAADGTEQPVFELESISPAAESTTSFDLPACNVTKADSTHDDDGCKTDEDGAPMEAPPPPPGGASPILPPHIIINTSPLGSKRGTPTSTPSGSLRSIRSNGSTSLPITRPSRSASSPNTSYLFPSEDYDQLDRGRSKSIASGTSSACESGTEPYDVLHVKHQRRRRNSKSSLNKKRHSLDRLAKVSRTEESDTESDYSSPMFPGSISPRLQAKRTPSSSDSFSGSDQADLKCDTRSDGYVRVPSFPGFARSASPKLVSPTTLSVDPPSEDPYLVTNLADWRATAGEQYHPNNNDFPAEAVSGSDDKVMPAKTSKTDYETPVYAKPYAKSKANISSNNGTNISVNNGDKNQAEADQNEPEADENEPEADETQPEADETQPEADETQPEADEDNIQNHDYFVLNIPKRSSCTLDDENESVCAVTENDVMKRSDNRNDYETPIGDVQFQSKQDGGTISNTIQQTNDVPQIVINNANRESRVDDYETPIVDLMKPQSQE